MWMSMGPVGLCFTIKGRKNKGSPCSQVVIIILMLIWHFLTLFRICFLGTQYCWEVNIYWVSCALWGKYYPKNGHLKSVSIMCVSAVYDSLLLSQSIPLSSPPPDDTLSSNVIIKSSFTIYGLCKCVLKRISDERSRRLVYFSLRSPFISSGFISFFFPHQAVAVWDITIHPHQEPRLPCKIVP